MTIRKQKVPRRPGRLRFTMVVPSKEQIRDWGTVLKRELKGRELTDTYVNWINRANHYKT